MKSMGMSEDSVETYLRFNKALIKFANKPLMEIDETDIKGFLVILLENNAKNVASMALSAIRFFHQGVLEKKFPDLEYSEKQKREVDRQKMVKMLKSTKNMKHKLLIELVFGCGLKVSEAIRLKKEDINMKKSLIKVRSKKGDHMVRIPNLVARDLAFLTHYSQKKNPYVFQPATGRENQKHISKKCVENMLVCA